MESTSNENEMKEEATLETEEKLAGDNINAETEEVQEKVNAAPEVDYKEKYYYLAAEMQNMQRRFDKEKSNLLKYGNENILNDLVDVLDNLERTLGFIRADEDEKVKNIVVGIEMINKIFADTLEKHGLKQIEALGKEFDPNFHEALAQQPTEGKKDMEVIQVHQNGYTLNDRVIRPAKVVVAKN